MLRRSYDVPRPSTAAPLKSCLGPVPERVLCDRGSTRVTLLFAGLDSWPSNTTGCLVVQREPGTNSTTCTLQQLKGNEIGGGVVVSWTLDLTRDLDVFPALPPAGLLPLIGWRFSGLRFTRSAAAMLQHHAPLQLLLASRSEEVTLKLWALRWLQGRPGHALVQRSVPVSAGAPDPVADSVTSAHAVLGQLVLRVHPDTAHVYLPVAHEQDLSLVRPWSPRVPFLQWRAFARRIASQDLAHINQCVHGATARAETRLPPMSLMQRADDLARRARRLPRTRHPHDAHVKRVAAQHFERVSESPECVLAGVRLVLAPVVCFDDMILFLLATRPDVCISSILAD